MVVFLLKDLEAVKTGVTSNKHAITLLFIISAASTKKITLYDQIQPI